MTPGTHPLLEQFDEKTIIAEPQLREVLDAVGAGIVISDLDGVARLANRDWEEMFGLRSEEVIGRPAEEALELLAGLFRQPGQYRSVVEAGRADPTCRGTHQLELAYPVPRILQCQTGPITKGAGRMLGRVMIYRDVSQQRALERDLQHLETQRVLAEMAQDLAHDFSNIFESLACTIYLLRMPRASQDPAWAGHLLDLLEQAVRLGSETVGLIREYSLDYDPGLAPLELAEPVLAGLRLVEPKFNAAVQLKGRHLELRPELERGVVIQGNSTELKRVVANLLLNAIDAIVKDGAIHVSVSTEEGQAVLRISDTGCGIPEDSLGRIFDSQFTTRKSGWGRGLAIVHRVVRRHGGAITVTSSESGTIFNLTFPLWSKP